MTRLTTTVTFAPDDDVTFLIVSGEVSQSFRVTFHSVLEEFDVDAWTSSGWQPVLSSLESAAVETIEEAALAAYRILHNR